MDRNLAAMCGAYCGDCEWKEKTGCPGCQSSQGNMFWGKCAIAGCCTKQGHEHCGMCASLPCPDLKAAFEMPEHGDNGERLANLKTWAAGKDAYVRLTKRKTEG
ncbi:MAG: DUF3795 domain-containing protein [Christensenellales bacterium]